jgi:hypothetical protein
LRSLNLIRLPAGKEAEANAAEASIGDPVARKLAEW